MESPIRVLLFEYCCHFFGGEKLAIPKKKDFDFTNAEDGRHIPEARHLNRWISLRILRRLEPFLKIPGLRTKVVVPNWVVFMDPKT